MRIEDVEIDVPYFDVEGLVVWGARPRAPGALTCTGP